jgi:P27 family predicted phage terminase small subunit
LAGRPKVPSHLSPEARRAWKQLVALLEERGTLSRADSMILSIWAETQSRWIAAKADIQRFGIVVESSVLDSNGTAVTARKPTLRFEPWSSVKKICGHWRGNLGALLLHVTA